MKAFSSETFLAGPGIASDFIHRRHNVYDYAGAMALQGHRIGICIPVLGELWDGIEYSKSRDRNADRLARALPRLLLWPFDELAAEIYGRLSAELRRNGRPMQQIDVQVAAIALSLGNCTVVTTDSDFAVVPGLRIENWRKTS